MAEKSKKNIVISIFIILMISVVSLFVFYPLGSVSSDAATTASSVNSEISSVKDKLSSLESKQNSIEKSLAAAKNKKEASLESKQLLEEQISSLQEEINVLSDYISSLTKDEKILEDKIEDLQKEYDEYYKKYCARVRENYEKGSISYLEIILGSKNFSDMLTRIDYVAAVMEYDNTLLKNMEANLEETKQSKETLENAISENKAASQRLASKKSTYSSKISTLETTIDNLEEDINAYGAELAEFSRLEREFQSQLDALMNKQIAYMGGDYFIWPVPSSSTKTSYFGYRTYYINGRYVTDYHDALDISAPLGTPIVAAGSGKVIFAGWVNTGGGYKTVIDHGGNIGTQYCHQSKILVSAGQSVNQGDTIGLVGHTGTATGNHLHFKITVNGTAVNPIYYVNYRNDFSVLKKISG